MSDFWKWKNVFITGCTGFLGYWLTDYLLREGATIVGLVRDSVPQSSFFRFKLNEKVSVVRGEVENFLLLERIINEYEVDTVLHLAAQPIVGTANRSSLATFETNVKGTWNLLEACRRSHPLVKRILVASSDKAYGIQEDLPYTEEAPLQGSHPYDVSKTCADLIASSFFTTYQLPVAITRCGNFYGGGDLNFNRLVCGTIRSVLHNKPVVIRSDGTPKRDYIYIEDAVTAYTTLAEKLEEHRLFGEAFNFSGGQPVSVLDMTKLILELMHKKDHPVEILNQSSGEIKDQYLSTQKSQKILQWTPHHSLEEGLGKTIDWYQSFFGLQ
jgi:CDP-glucose 4,6-dehydratase